VDEALVTIARFHSAFEAHEARIELEDLGIPAVVADETLVNLAFPGELGLGGVRLQVREFDVRRAVDALAQTPAANDLVVEATEEPDDGQADPE